MGVRIGWRVGPVSVSTRVGPHRRSAVSRRRTQQRQATWLAASPAAKALSLAVVGAFAIVIAVPKWYVIVPLMFLLAGGCFALALLKMRRR